MHINIGKQLDTQKQIAIKMIKVGEFKDGLDMSAIREIKFLQEIRHPNIIELIDVFSTQSNLNIVLEFLPADLEMIIKDRSIIFTPADIKSWLLMTLRGLHHCHRNFVLHRVRSFFTCQLSLSLSANSFFSSSSSFD